ncbi:MAG: DUF2067 domain-containing protein [Thermofilaceae archaeon]|nr:DUF2067 domain-containing protein [Thermofilaceae archaeon]
MKEVKKRVVTIKFSSSTEALDFLVFALSSLKNVTGEQVGSKVKLVLISSSDEPDDDYHKIISIVRQWGASRQYPRAGLYRHSLGLLLSTANLVVGIPVEAVAELLALKGFKAQLEGGNIVTNADFKLVVKVAEVFAEKYARALQLESTPQVKRLVALYAATYECTIDQAVDELKRRGLVKEEENTRRLVLTASYSECLEAVKRR